MQAEQSFRQVHFDKKQTRTCAEKMHCIQQKDSIGKLLEKNHSHYYYPEVVEQLDIVGALVVERLEMKAFEFNLAKAERRCWTQLERQHLFFLTGGIDL